jgi:hypothetical protein
MKCMPESKETALSPAQLFSETTVTSIAIGKKALKELFEAGAVQRVGKGSFGNPFRYFANNAERLLNGDD